MRQALIRHRWLRYLPLAVLMILGAAGGYLYYRLVGCAQGSCAITSNPVSSTFYGGIIGILLGVIATPDKNKIKRQNGEENHG